MTERLQSTAFVQDAVRNRENLSVFREKPTAQTCLGILLILLSYVIGWPAVAVLGWIAFSTGNPLVVIIGGPLAYGLSHLVFLVGLYFAGKRYALSLAKWATRKAVEKIAK
jgi:hypothetical protein